MAAVWAWPWLGLTVGWFAGRHALGLDGTTAAVLTPTLSLALCALVWLPSVVVAGGPTVPGLVGTTVAFALACRALGGRLRLPLAVPPPSATFLAFLALVLAARLLHAVVTAEADALSLDGAFFTGMVACMRDFPPSSYSASSTLMKQPWGFWLVYGALEAASGLGIARTLALASVFVSAALLLAVYACASVAVDDRRAGGLAVLLALGAAETRWIVRSLTSFRFVPDFMTAGTIDSFGGSLWFAFYNLPALCVAALALLFLVADERAPDDRLVWAAAAVLAVLPLQHPVSYVVLAIGLGLAAVAGHRLGALRRAHLVVLLTPVPFYVLYVLLYAGGVRTRFPFAPHLDPHWTPARAGFLLAYAGLWVPAALFAARRPFAGRRVFGCLGLASAALAVFATNFQGNYRWMYDPLALALTVLGGVGLAELWQRPGPLGRTLAVVVVGLSLVPVRYPGRLAEIRARPPRSTPEQRELAEWVKANTPRRAVGLAPPEGHLHGAVTALAERPLFLGMAFHVTTVLTSAEVERLQAEQAAMLADACSPLLARNRVAFAAFARERVPVGWAERLPPAFVNRSFAAFRVAPCVAAPGR